MKNTFTRSIFVALSTLSLAAHAVLDIRQVPSIDLRQAVPGSTLQAVEDIPDKTKLSIFYNELLLQEKMNIPGWNQSTNNRPDTDEILKVFGVRTTQDPAKVRSGDSIFYAGRGVGRSGV
ncbi:MAG: hypothetical protein N2578_05390, partial [Bdellovibrionaceae bacterium]|nr:hypothetical protein [Pseudobdellovibrionaceae bacterium]